MMKTKRFLKLGTLILALLCVSLFAVGCSQSPESSVSADSTDSTASSEEVSKESSVPTEKVTVKIATSSDEPRVWNAVQSVLDAKGYNITIEPINFGDSQLNRVLADGEVDLNSFQHYAYFNQNIKDLDLDLTAIGDTLIVPLSVFSVKYQSIDELPDGAKIAIPDDATNQGRALNVLKNAGLIDLAPGVGNNGLIKDVTDNPKHIELIEITGAQIPHSLEDVDAGIINCGFATDFGLDPVKDPIFKDEIDLKNPEQQPFINIIAARTEDKDNETYLKVVEAYHSREAADAIAEVYANAALPAFDVPEDYVTK